MEDLKRNMLSLACQEFQACLELLRPARLACVSGAPPSGRHVVASIQGLECTGQAPGLPGRRSYELGYRVVRVLVPVAEKTRLGLLAQSSSLPIMDSAISRRWRAPGTQGISVSPGIIMVLRAMVVQASGTMA
jgi:hypothetical protein